MIVRNEDVVDHITSCSFLYEKKYIFLFMTRKVRNCLLESETETDRQTDEGSGSSQTEEFVLLYWPFLDPRWMKECDSIFRAVRLDPRLHIQGRSLTRGSQPGSVGRPLSPCPLWAIPGCSPNLLTARPNNRDALRTCVYTVETRI